MCSALKKQVAVSIPALNCNSRRDSDGIPPDFECLLFQIMRIINHMTTRSADFVRGVTEPKLTAF